MGQPPDEMPQQPSDQPPSMGGMPPPPPMGQPMPPSAGPAVTPASTNDAVVLVIGALLFIVSFFAWYRIELTQSIAGVKETSQGITAWRLGVLLGWLPVLLGIGAAVVAGLRMAGTQLRTQMSPGVLYLIAGVVAFVPTVLRFIVRPTGSRGLEVLSGGAIQVTRGFGIYLALILTLGLLVAGFRAYQAEQRK